MPQRLFPSETGQAHDEDSRLPANRVPSFSLGAATAAKRQWISVGGELIFSCSVPPCFEAQGRGGSTAVGQLASIPDPWPDASESEPPSDPGDTTSLVNRAIAQLKPHIEPQTWEAFWQTAVLDCSAPEVAESLGMTPAAVRKAKSRTLHRLRQQLGDEP